MPRAISAFSRKSPTPFRKRGRAPPGDEESTRERILRVAERLFAEHGFNGVSVRALTAAADVNLAGVSYYFGSKEGLLGAIFERHCRPMAEERVRRLEACAEAAGRSPLLDQVIAAFIRPALVSSVDAARGGATFTRLRAMLAHDNNVLFKSLIEEHFDATSLRFIDAFVALLPELDRAELHWRFQFLLGALYYTMMTPERIRHLSDGVCDPADVDRAMDVMVRFVAAGFRAPGNALIAGKEPIAAMVSQPSPASAGGKGGGAIRALDRAGNARLMQPPPSPSLQTEEGGGHDRKGRGTAP
jgi:AcrR family transcriptional regulator